jgi:hypothetical protein
MKEMEMKVKDVVGAVNIIYASDKHYQGADRTRTIAKLIRKMKAQIPKNEAPDTDGMKEDEKQRVIREYNDKIDKQFRETSVNIKLEDAEFNIFKEFLNNFNIKAINAEAMADLFDLIDEAEKTKEGEKK